MNFLELVQRTNTLLGVQGTVTSITDTGYQETLVEIVKNAWIDIQNLRPEFNFFQLDTTFNTVQGQTEYSITDIFGTSIDPVSSYRGFLYNTAPIDVITKDEYILRDIVTQSEGKPNLIAIDPVNNHLFLNPPDSAYTISVYYFRKVQELAADTDVPICPSEFHNAIVYRAAADGAVFFGNSALYQQYNQKAASTIGALMRSQNPRKSINITGLV